MLSVYCICDLHMFCRRSTAQQHMAAIHSAVADADVFVLNGDIFDFRWTVFSTIEETVQPAIDWLDDLISRNPDCRFHYVLGNHDGLKDFIDALEVLAADRPNLTCHTDYVRLGSAIFLHGDATHRRMTAAGVEKFRARWLHVRRKGALANAVYDAAFALGLVGMVYRTALTRRRVADRLLYYLEDVGQGAGAGTRSVYHGHTHLAVCGYDHGGLRFYSGGASLPGMDFRVLKADIDDIGGEA